METAAIDLEPFAQIDMTMIHQDGFNEDGAGALNMRFGSQSTTQFAGTIGVNAQAAPITMPKDWQLIPKARIGWTHQFADRNSQTSGRFAIDPNVNFTAQNPKRDPDSAILSIDLAATPIHSTDFELFVTYDGNYNSSAQEHGISGGVSWRW